jgi:hypothetical protein
MTSVPISPRFATGLAGVLVSALGLADLLGPSAALAAQGTRAGWQYRVEQVDGSDHQYLTYYGKDNGPRMLAFSCERDNDTFAIAAEDLSELVGPLARATMQLSSGPATFTLPGIVDKNPDSGALGFLAEIPLSNGGFQQLAQTMPPLLLSGQPIKVNFGSRSREIPPVKGLLDPAKRFLRECFAPQQGQN